MRSAIFFVFTFFCAGVGYAQSPAKYPVVSAFKGSVQIFRSDKLLKVRPPEILYEKVRFKVGDKSWVRLELAPRISVQIEENSEVNIPSILWETGEVEQVELIHGKFHYLCWGSCRPFTLSTALSVETLSQGESLWSYDGELPQVTLTVLQGSQHFRGLEGEEDITLQSGERAAFVGILEEGKPAFDILLKNRKVARGKLEKKSPLSKQELAQWAQHPLRKKADLSSKPAVPKALKDHLRSEKLICRQPDGELNQCSWTCENNPKKATVCQLSSAKVQCVRRRCNANGQWTDATILSREQSPCIAKVMVKVCDY